MKKVITLCLTGLLLAISPLTFAQTNLKLGVVDLPKVLQSSPKVAAINKQLQTQFQPEQQKIIDMQNKLREETKQLNAGGGAQGDKQKLKDKVAADQRALEQSASQFQQKVSAAQSKAMQDLLSQINATVKTIAQAQQLDMVLLKPAVIYANNPIDITDQVVQQMPKS